MPNFYNKKGSGKSRGDDRGGFKGKKTFGAFGGNRRDNDRGDRGGDRERPDMHVATCSKCNASCKVPFRPNGKKPIYCSECFETEGNKGTDSRYSSPRSDRSSSFEKPAYRSTPRNDNDEVVKQLKALNIKMDSLIKTMTQLTVEPILDENEGEEIEESDETNENEA